MALKKLYKKYKSLILYIFFGICTTFVNIASFWFMAHIFNFKAVFSSIVSWILSVIFAYITNRKWVFHSEACSSKEIIKEMTTFFGCRLATGILDWIIMFVFVDLLSYNDVVIKVIANVIVIVLNYVASKVFIFRTHN